MKREGKPDGYCVVAFLADDEVQIVMGVIRTKAEAEKFRRWFCSEGAAKYAVWAVSRPRKKP